MSNIFIGGQGAFAGCDFVLQLGEERRNTPIKLLQLTDMQIIDSAQRRTPDRIRPDEINAWGPDKFDGLCGNHIRSLVAQTVPDIIFITGDIVYGSFDDKGTTFEWFCAFMDSLGIPWAPVWGNHDNETVLGVDWQCERLGKSENCIFKRGEVSGNSNYTVGIATGEELVRVLHMLDSNGCRRGNGNGIIAKAGLYPDQLALVENNTRLISEAQGRIVPAFMACHHPMDVFEEAERAKGYKTDNRECYVLGVDVMPVDGDFGFALEKHNAIATDEGFVGYIKRQGIDGVFVGHDHVNTTCIRYKDVVWTYGLKTGQYDYHQPGSLGGTAVTLFGDGFTVMHVPSLVPFAPMPGKAKMFESFFSEGSF